MRSVVTEGSGTEWGPLCSRWQILSSNDKAHPTCPSYGLTFLRWRDSSIKMWHLRSLPLSSAGPRLWWGWPSESFEAKSRKTTHPASVSSGTSSPEPRHHAMRKLSSSHVEGPPVGVLVTAPPLGGSVSCRHVSQILEKFLAPCPQAGSPPPPC